MLKNIYLGLRFSLSYFSILPISFKSTDDLSSKEVLAFMLFFLPFVGFILATLTVILFFFLSSLSWFGALISATFYMILYGFLHTEAIMDVADAIYAKHSGKDAYKIIKEPTVGAMGVLYGSSFMLIKVVGVAYFLMQGYFMEFIAIAIISRLSLLLLFDTYEFRSSFTTMLKKSLTKPYLFGSFSIFSIVGYLLVSNFMILLFMGLLLALLISFVIKSKIGFLNGDVLGATLEVVEILLLIGISL